MRGGMHLAAGSSAEAAHEGAARCAGCGGSLSATHWHDGVLIWFCVGIFSCSGSVWNSLRSSCCFVDWW